jgi:hypothetical protein
MGVIADLLSCPAYGNPFTERTWLKSNQPMKNKRCNASSLILTP